MQHLLTKGNARQRPSACSEVLGPDRARTHLVVHSDFHHRKCCLMLWVCVRFAAGGPGHCVAGSVSGDVRLPRRGRRAGLPEEEAARALDAHVAAARRPAARLYLRAQGGGPCGAAPMVQGRRLACVRVRRAACLCCWRYWWLQLRARAWLPCTARLSRGGELAVTRPACTMPTCMHAACTWAPCTRRMHARSAGGR